MYRTCIYCNRNLGSNELIENFPVGRRLAFDGDRGRLWVVCGACGRWNLSPIEERWEAIEECERRFHGATQRYSTDNVGLARPSSALDLIRIGRPQRLEFAAWRYGREFVRRRVRSLIVAGSKVAVSVAGALAGADIFWVFILGGKQRVVARVKDESGARLCITRKQVGRVELSRSQAGDGWSLVLPYQTGERLGLFGARGKGSVHYAELTGPVALRAAEKILPRINSWGGTEAQIRRAVDLIEESGEPERLFERIVGSPRAVRGAGGLDVGSTFLKKMDSNVRLALEMAAHEESERRALEGELAVLEEAWREAEEIAAIADSLLMPESVERALERLRRELSRG